MSERSTGAREDVRDIQIRKEYLNLIIDGIKTVEVRVGYPSMRRITAGQLLRFVSGDQTFLTRVTAVREYGTFADMLDHQDPPDKEALGVLAIHIRPEPDQGNGLAG